MSHLNSKKAIQERSNPNIRHGRHCIFLIHAHLVFITKYRRMCFTPRVLREEDYPKIRKKLWGKALWSPSYFAGSCGGAPLELIKQYIEQQERPH